MDTTSRDKRIILNAVVGIGGQILTIIIGFVSRKIFIVYLGQSLSGLGSVFTNILSFLNIATTGIASVAQYKIFQYNSKDDIENLNKVYYFMRKMYTTVSFGILILGILLSFHVEWLIHDNPYSRDYLQLTFLIMLVTDCISYLYAHIRAFLAAMERMFVYNFVYTVIYFTVTMFNLVSVVIWKNYILYLLILLFQNILIGCILYVIVRNQFSFLKKKEKGKFLDTPQLLGEIRNVFPRALAKFVYSSTDSVVISGFLGLISVNIYANYTMIILNLNKLVSHFTESLRYSIGNRLFEKRDQNSVWEYTKLITCMEFVIASTLSAITYAFVDYFVGEVWLGEDFLVGHLVRGLLCCELYFKLMGEPLVVLMNVTGKFRDDKVAFCSASICNIILSIFFVKKCGLAGVLIGTLSSEIIMFIYRTIKVIGDSKNIRKYIYMQSTMCIVTMVAAQILYFFNQYAFDVYGILGVIVIETVAVVVFPLLSLLLTNRYYKLLPIIKKVFIKIR